MQGTTITKGSKLIVHWQKGFKDGMAYVMLGRSESLEDIYIAGDFDPSLIKCDKEALKEAKRIEEAVNLREKEEESQIHNEVRVSYLNVRSILPHLPDVQTIPMLMQSEVFALGETWLLPGQTCNIDDWTSAFESRGHGKGLAVYSKVSKTKFHTFSTENLSAACATTNNEFNCVFVYLSKGFEWNILKDLFEKWLDAPKPSVILGDVNWDWNSTHPMKNYLQKRGYAQLISRSTHEGGHILDHIYTSPLLPKGQLKVNQQSVTFSDHDIITLSFCRK